MKYEFTCDKCDCLFIIEMPLSGYNKMSRTCRILTDEATACGGNLEHSYSTSASGPGLIFKGTGWTPKFSRLTK